MGAGPNLTDHSIRSMFLSDQVAEEWACAVSWPLDLENSIWRKHGDLFQTFFFNRRCPWEECGNLFKGDPGKEGEADGWEGGKVDVIVRSPSHWQWWHYRDGLCFSPSLSFLSPVLFLPVSPALCATPELVAHLSPLVQQLLLASGLWHSS